MPTNYGVSPTWLAAPPTDVLNPILQSADETYRMRAARRAAAMQANAQEMQHAQQLQQQAQQNAFNRDIQEKELAIKNQQAADAARESAMKFEADQRIRNAMSKLGPTASLEDIAKVWAINSPSSSGIGSLLGSGIRSQTQDLSSLEPNVSEIPGGGKIIQLGNKWVYQQPREQVPFAARKQIEAAQKKVDAARSEYHVAAKAGEPEQMARSVNALRLAEKDLDDLIKPLLPTQTTEGTTTEELTAPVKEPSATSTVAPSVSVKEKLVKVINPQGKLVNIKESQLDEAIASGYKQAQ